MSLEMTVVDQLEHLHRALALMEEVGADEPVAFGLGGRGGNNRDRR